MTWPRTGARGVAIPTPLADRSPPRARAERHESVHSVHSGPRERLLAAFDPSQDPPGAMAELKALEQHAAAGKICRVGVSPPSGIGRGARLRSGTVQAVVR